jgi:hypothetical protein
LKDGEKVSERADFGGNYVLWPQAVGKHGNYLCRQISGLLALVLIPSGICENGAKKKPGSRQAFQ